MDDSSSGEEESGGAGHDIALHLHPSRPGGAGHEVGAAVDEFEWGGDAEK